jgi:hypothetical protein
MDERETPRAEREARKEMRERPVRSGTDPIARYFALVAYSEGHARGPAPEPDGSEPES